ncbi:MAG: metallophosphoesterase [Cyanobacteria bacterium J06621_8]
MRVKRSLSLLRKLRIWLSKLTLITLVLAIACYVYAKKIEPNWVEIVPVRLAIPHLAPAFTGFKIVQISDLHANHFIPEQRLTKIIQLVNQQQPDAIAITGDFITHGYDFDPDKLALKLSQLQSKSGNLAVLGNHDHWRKKLEMLKQTLKEGNISLLENQVYSVERGNQQLAFAGIDDPYWGQPDLAQAIAQIPDNATAILLVHEPDYIEQSAKTERFALQLSGHSHGGQIKIPWIDPFFLPRGGRKYFAGLDRVENTWTYTNRGLGMTGIPLRFASRPEITVFTLYPTS